MQKTILAIALILGTWITTSCQKLPGEGGRATIKGRVWMDEYNPLGDLIGSYAAADERVYIQYGENEIYDDEMRTHHDGKFAFNYLKAGNYTIFCYSECDSCDSGISVVTQSIVLDNNKDAQDIGDITINKY